MATDDEDTAAAQRLGDDPVYAAVIKALHACSQKDETVRTDDAVMALGNVMGSLASASGILWESTELIDALRGLADDLEQRRENEQAPPRRATLREVFAADAAGHVAVNRCVRQKRKPPGVPRPARGNDVPLCRQGGHGLH